MNFELFSGVVVDDRTASELFPDSSAVSELFPCSSAVSELLPSSSAVPEMFAGEIGMILLPVVVPETLASEIVYFPCNT